MKHIFVLTVLMLAALAVSAQTQFKANLTWTAPTVVTGTTISGYSVYRTITGSTSYTLLNATPVTATTYADTTISAGTSYQYYIETVATISGVTGSVDSVPSNVITLVVPTLPPAPTGLTGTVTQ